MLSELRSNLHRFITDTNARTFDSRVLKESMSLEREAGRSRFMNSLSYADRALILGHCRSIALPNHTVLYESEVRPSNAYILTSGLASVVTSMPDGSTVEVGVLGREGVACALHLLGPSMISTRCLMQLEGTGFSIPLAELAILFAQSPTIRARLLEFVQSQAASLGQIAACHRLHLAEERLARWLLMVQDRVESDRLDLTQEFLGNMLGSRRTTVTKAAGVLERTGAIEFTRGHLHIIDRERLIAAACVCYPVTQQLLSGLYGLSLPDAA
jgi:CRP-like cAMP-binding protein